MIDTNFMVTAINRMKTALISAEATLALCAGKVPPYVEVRRRETVEIIREALKHV